MTRPPCVRLCPAYPGNPRTRIEGESPPLCKGTYGLRSALSRARVSRDNGEAVARGWPRGPWFETPRESAAPHHEGSFVACRFIHAGRPKAGAKLAMTGRGLR